MRNIFLLLFLLLLNSCSDEKPKPPYEFENEATLIYLAADNNLSSFITANFNEIEANFPSDATNRIFVFIDLYQGDNLSQATLYEVIEDSADNTKIVSTELANYGVVNSSSMEMFDRIFSDLKLLYPETVIKNILLSSHGKSWIPDGSSLYRTQQYSFGDDYSADGDQIDIDEIAYVLEKQDIDNIIFDACYMSSIEVYYELRNAADIIIASPAEVMAAGMNYSSLTKMFAHNTVDPQKVIEDYKTKYISHYDPYYSLTYCVTENIEALAQLNNELLIQYDAESKSSSLTNYLPTYCPYYSSFLLDYYSYFEQLGISDSDRARLDALWTATFPYYLHSDSMYSMVDLKQSNGVSFYYPKTSIPDTYNNYYLSLDWPISSGFNRIL